jgi:hypothetical protein
MLTAIRTTLASAGICDPVQRLAADSGYWSIANVSAIPDAPELLIPPARHGRHGKPRKDGKPSVSTSDSLRAAMLARLGSERARSATSSVAGPSNRSSVRSRPSRAAAGSCAAGCWPVRPNGSCCAALTTGETHLRNALRSATRRRSRTGTGTPCPLAPGVWEGRGRPAWGRPGDRTWQGVFGAPIPGLAAEEERPQVRVVEPEGQWDGVAEVGKGLVGGQLSSRQTRHAPGGA